jgi:2-polyprenyl-3-methyl-5-hydroxy-6-metoxy-1,4-benzoquinol methylase
VPRDRDPHRHRRLLEHIRTLWGDRDYVEIRQCTSCGFGFTDPWVAGDAEFYALVHEAKPHYPRDRWEFGKTIAAISRASPSQPLRLLEIGAGGGAFLDQVRQLPSGSEFTLIGADYDEGAVAALESKGYAAVAGSVEDARTALGRTTVDVVCMFQTLEHIATIDDVLACLVSLLRPSGSLFLSMPNAAAVEFQETATRYWDMPPNHVGRWSPVAIQWAAEAHGLRVAEIDLQPVRAWATAWQLAVYSVNARAYRTGTLEARCNGIRVRPLRGPLKRLLAAIRVPGLLARRGEFQPLTVWAHLVAPSP